MNGCDVQSRGVGTYQQGALIATHSREPQLHVDAAAVLRVRPDDGVLIGRVTLNNSDNNKYRKHTESCLVLNQDDLTTQRWIITKHQ